MKNIWTVFKKEWDRVFKDRRLVITVILLPGFMIFLIYSFIGQALNNSLSQTKYDITIVNNLDSFSALYSTDENIDNILIANGDALKIDQYKEQVDQSEIDLLIVFSDHFLDYDGQNDKGTVYIYYNPNESDSSSIYATFTGYLSIYQSQLIYNLHGDVSYFNTDAENTAIDSHEQMGSMMSQLLPMLVIMFLFSGALSIGPESISGEKERNTLSTLLITPIKRSEIALGKIFGLSVLSLLSALSSFLGILLSLPKLLSLEGSSVNIYSFSDYFLILLVLFSTVFVIIGIVSIISAYAKNVKEASTMIMPVYLITVLVSITSLFNSGASTNLLMYLLPIYNSVQTLTAVLSFDPQSISYLLITVASNVVYLVIFVFILNKMFNNEKIMFSK